MSQRKLLVDGLDGNLRVGLGTELMITWPSSQLSLGPWAVQASPVALRVVCSTLLPAVFAIGHQWRYSDMWVGGQCGANDHIMSAYPHTHEYMRICSLAPHYCLKFCHWLWMTICGYVGLRTWVYEDMVVCSRIHIVSSIGICIADMWTWGYGHLVLILSLKVLLLSMWVISLCFHIIISHIHWGYESMLWLKATVLVYYVRIRPTMLSADLPPRMSI